MVYNTAIVIVTANEVMIIIIPRQVSGTRLVNILILYYYFSIKKNLMAIPESIPRSSVPEFERGYIVSRCLFSPNPFRSSESDRGKDVDRCCSLCRG